MAALEDEYIDWPLSIAQQSMWLIHNCSSDKSIYNSHYVWKLPDSVDLTILKASLEHLVSRHAILRALFIPTDDGIIQRVYKNKPLRFYSYQIEEVNDTELSETILNEELKKPFELDKETAMRWVLISRPNGSRVLGAFFHHLILDMGSFMIFVNELKNVYECIKNNTKINLPDITQNYSDFITKQNSFLETPQGRVQEDYWRTELNDVNTSLDLPLDFNRPTTLESTTGYLNTFIPSDITTKFNQFAADNKLSLFSLYISTFHLLLHKISGNTDISIGAPTGGRGGDFDGVFGYFTNPVIIRSHTLPEVPLINFFKKMDIKVKLAIKNQTFPISKVAEKIKLERSSSKASLFQTSFVWQNINAFENRDTPFVTWDKKGKRFWDFGEAGIWERFNRRQQLDDLDLTFKIYKFKNDLHMGFEYNSSLFKAETIERFSSYFKNLMTCIAENPSQKISEISIIPNKEFEKLTVEFNQTKQSYNSENSFITLFQDKASSCKNKPAVQLDDKILSYKQLNEKANRLAHFLIESGVKTDDIVGVSLDRSPELIIAILAILKSGGVYLPLDPAYPVDRTSYILNNAKASHLLTSKNQTFKNTLQISFIYLDQITKELQKYPTRDIVRTINPESRAYIIYTSGSTGRPKGVEITHKGLCALINAQHNTFDLPIGSNVLQFASINFDASIFEIVMALSSGSILHLARKEELIGEGLFEVLSDRKINWAVLPPAVVTTLDNDKLPHLNTLITAGESCSEALVKRWSQGRDFYNAYGPTETTVWATVAKLDSKSTITIGKPIANTTVYLLDPHLNPVPIGVPGELHIGGDGLAKGYLNQPELTAEKFIPNPFSKSKSSRIYKSGDLARYLPDGNIEFLGRLDHQIKIRGFRVELGEIEATLLNHPQVVDVLVMARNDMTGKAEGEALLAAYIITKNEHLQVSDLKALLKEQLPDYMVPSGFVLLDAFPLTPNEKIDRKALPIPELGSGKKKGQQQLPRNEIEKAIAGVWQDVLNLSDVSTDENFFDLGGHSLLLAQAYNKFPENLKNKLTMVDLFKYPTIHTLAQFLELDDEEEDVFFLQHDEHIERMRLRRRLLENIRGLKIAIVGMSGRFPGAENVNEFWQNILNKEESIRFFSDDELLKAGVDKNLVNDPAYVAAKGAIKNPKGFDAPFFGYSPRDAQITDPQHRLFLECAHEALEDAACVPSKFKGLIGVYAGTGINNYLMNHISAHQSLVNAVGDYPVMIGNDKDFLSNRVSYKLNLNGPAMVIQTACSTSLVAIHSACQALLNEECDAALAGGVSLGKLDDEGYLFKEGMIMSPDGHCRPFDEKAKGTLLGQGAGVVLLKRLDDALRDNDHIYAIIKGSGINNDGSAKSGYTAPSIEGQAKAVMLAHASANVSPEQISYIEAHGTGTPLGDPIEIEGLNYAFRHSANMSTGKPNSCAIGSVKSNIGHTDAASGVVGLIKSAKALEQKILPPSLHFETANPKINFKNSPFYVNTETQHWPAQAGLRHSGVSSFGIGGTNAHIVLSEAPSKTDSGRSRPWRIITLSAKTETALEAMTVQFHAYLSTHPEVSFSDICYTLHMGRQLFEHRRYLVCENTDDAILELSKILPDTYSKESGPKDTSSKNSSAKKSSSRIITKVDTKIPRKLAFMFSGQGSQYVNMARKLYMVELTFRKEIDHCRNILKERFVFLFERLVEDDFNALSDKIHDTYITQPTLFITEYALAKTLMSWNIQPEVMIGHSIGEYVAACLAGVFTLEQALELVTIRGRMIYDLEKGDMLMVELSEQDAQAYLNESLSLAAINGEQRCVISGQSEAIITLQKQLTDKEVQNRILHTSHAFHSHMMDDILEDFTSSVARRTPQKPKLPFISSLTGKMITDQEATSPDYWAQHLRNTVRFHQGLETLFNFRDNESSGLILMEVGPGKTLATLARQHPDKTDKDVVYETMRHSYEDISDTKKLLTTIAKLWINNVDIDWEVFHSNRQRYKTPLPTYPFERLDYWVESGKKMRLTQDRRGMNEQALPPLPDKKYLVQTAKTEVVEMRDHFDAFICQLWEKSLGVNKVGIHDNYFDLGGDSLRAVSIVDKLVVEYNTPIATHILIQKPTVAELADYIKSVTRHPEAQGAQDNKQAHTLSLVTIQQGNERKQPLFMVHPIGGEVYFYRDLAHQLGADQPLFAFQATSLSGQSEPYEDVETMATDYISELKAIGAKPPYLLGGSSFGGLVAYEMAQQLKENGEEVRLLVMIDTPFPSEMPAHLTNSAAILNYLLADKIPLDLARLNKLDPKSQIDYVLEEARLRGKSEVIPPHLGVPLFNTWIAHQKATFAYEPKRYTDDVMFFRHTERMEHFPPEPHKTWEDQFFGGKIEVHKVAGDHITMNFNPNVKALAAYLKAALKGSASQIQREVIEVTDNILYPQSYEIPEEI